jgi:hypothetical protein
MAYSRQELEAMKMADIRKIGAEIGAKDTDKGDLINEILAKQPGQDDTGQLIEEIKIRQGDTVRTYDLRDRILAKLEKLKGLEGGI